MNAVWYVRSKQMRQSMRFWLAITGYDLNDESFTNRVYLLYLLIFFALWGLAVLAMLTSGSAGLLTTLYAAHPAWAAARLTGFLLLGWWLWGLWGAARRSPIRFSPEDAQLICSTPVSRRSVVFAWLPAAWFTSGVFFWGAAVTLGFGLAEISVGGKFVWADLPIYMGSGLRFFVPVLLQQAGLLMVVWALGSARLRGSRDLPLLIVVPLGAVLLSGATFLLAQPGGALLGLSVPLLGPILSGCGLLPFWPGFVAAVVWIVVGAVALTLLSPWINLSRAAQESERSSLPSDTESSRLKQRLQSSAPARLPIRPGGFASLWKQVLRTARGLSLGLLLDGLTLFGLSLGFLFAPEWGSRTAILLFWGLKLQGRSSSELRADLAQWQLFQSLPLRPQQRIWIEAAPSALLTAGLGWLAFGVGGGLLQAHVPLALVLLLPLAAFNVTLAGLYDVLRSTHSEHLLSGAVPAPGMLGALVGGLAVGFSAAALGLAGSGGLGLIASAACGAAASLLLLQLCQSGYQKMGK